MKENLPKISEATELNDITWSLEENYNSVSIEWYPILAKWLDNSYSVFKAVSYTHLTLPTILLV